MAVACDGPGVDVVCEERNRDLEIQQSFSNIKPLSEAYASREGLIFCRPTGVRIRESYALEV